VCIDVFVYICVYILCIHSVITKLAALKVRRVSDEEQSNVRYIDTSGYDSKAGRGIPKMSVEG